MSAGCDYFIMEECCDSFDMIEYVQSFDMGINFLLGPPTPSEVIFIPSVDADGWLSWTNDGGLPNPEPVNIKGPPGAGAVESVNGRTGVVVLTSVDIGLGNVANERQYSANNPPPYPVTSVAGKTGTVSLVPADVGLSNVANERQYSANNPPPYPVTSVNGDTGDVVPDLEVSAAFAIPAAGSSVSYNLSGLTDKHELVRWNFSASAENAPPADLEWHTYAGYFTITNNGGTTSETMRPMFSKPKAVAATAR